MLPSHNCIIIINVQFSRYIFEFPFKKLNETPDFSEISVNLLIVIGEVVGQNGLEPSTSRLSVVCSSQLSYWPIFGGD